MPGGGSSKETVSNIPWAGVQPYLTGAEGIPGILPTAAEQFASPRPSFFPRSTVAGLDPAQVRGFDMTAARAMGGSPLNRAAGAETLRTLEGGYLEGNNPYLDAVRQRGMRDASAIAGRLSGGGEHSMQSAIAEGYGNAVAPYMFNAYEAERGRMGDAARFAPQLAGQDYLDAAALTGVGQARQAQSQAELQSEIDRHNFGQTIEQQKLAQYADLIRGISSPYGTQVGTTPSPGIGQSVLGGLLGLGSMFASPFKPWFLA